MGKLEKYRIMGYDFEVENISYEEISKPDWSIIDKCYRRVNSMVLTAMTVDLETCLFFFNSRGVGHATL